MLRTFDRGVFALFFALGSLLVNAQDCPCDGSLSNDASVTPCNNGRCSLYYSPNDYQTLLSRIYTSASGGNDGFSDAYIRNQMRPSCVQRSIQAQYGDVAVTVWHPLRITITTREEAQVFRANHPQVYGRSFIMHYCGLRETQEPPCRQVGQGQWAAETCYSDGIGNGFINADGRILQAAFFRSAGFRSVCNFGLAILLIVTAICFYFKY